MGYPVTLTPAEEDGAAMYEIEPAEIERYLPGHGPAVSLALLNAAWMAYQRPR